MKQMMQLIR